MGAKTWMLVHAEGDAREALSRGAALDRVASEALARRLFADEALMPIDDGSLCWTAPPDDEIVVGCFPGVAVIAAKEFGLDRPSRLPARFLAERGTTTLHAMHSVVDWFAYAVWSNGRLLRSLSVSPDDGVIEDLGERQPFELPFWAGECPVGDPGDEDSAYPLPFHPLELGEEALAACFGYQIEGPRTDLDPEAVPLLRLRRVRTPWWGGLLGRR